MVKRLLRIGLLCVFGLTMAVSSLSAFKPEELYKDQVAVLIYHHISDQAQSGGTIRPSLFRDQLSYLQSQGYSFITLADFKRYLAGASVPDNAVLVTFDDGYESFYTEAYPILKEMAIPAVNFVITGTIANPKSGNIPFLSRDELDELGADKGLIDLECHSDSLHDKIDGKALLTHKGTSDGKTESDAEYRNRIVSDAQGCRQKLASYGEENGTALAYPFGIYSRSAIAALQEGGIRYAFTVMPKLVTRNSDPMRLPRLNAGSPFVSPETLHNMIMRRTTGINHPRDLVPLRETVEQIGGELFKDKADGNVVILYNGDQFKISADKTSVTRLKDGTAVALSSPLEIAGRRTQIRLADLQQILGISIRLDKATGTYTTDSPAESDTDTEAKHIS